MQVRYIILETTIYTAYTMVDLLDDVLVFVRIINLVCRLEGLMHML